MSDKPKQEGLPVAPIRRLIKKTTNARVSEKAAFELKMILESFGQEISMRAIELAKHRNKETVKDQDIRLAYKQM